MSTTGYNLGNFNQTHSTQSRQSQRSNNGLGKNQQSQSQKKINNVNALTQKNQSAAQLPTIQKIDPKQAPIHVVEGGLSDRIEKTNNTKNNKVAFDERNKNETVQSMNPMTQTELARKTNYSVYDIESVYDDVRRSYINNPKITHDPEAEYYETVRRLDVCGHCWAAQRKYCTHAFKLREKGPGNTLYQKDYVAHPIQKGPVMKNDFYTTFNIEEPMDLATTMKNDYKDWKAGAPPRAHIGNKSAASGVPFGGRSGYKTEYINWGAMPVNLEKAPHNITTIKDLPFNSKSAYQENFGAPDSCEQARPVDRDLWNKNKKSPLSTGIPFLGQTTTAQTYKPYKVAGVPMFLAKDEYEPTEAYPDQFRSTYDQEYTAHSKWKCPAKIFMETHPHPKG
jgi:hypothetical protein